MKLKLGHCYPEDQESDAQQVKANTGNHRGTRTIREQNKIKIKTGAEDSIL